MEYLRTTTKQEAVTAETVEEAQTKSGKTIDITVRVISRPSAAATPPTQMVGKSMFAPGKQS